MIFKKSKKFFLGDLDGFTLIELLLVIMMIVILITSSSMYLYKYSINKAIENEATRLAFVLRQARDKSISQDDQSEWGVLITNPVSGAGYYDFLKNGTSTSSGMQRYYLTKKTTLITPTSGSSVSIIFTKMTGFPKSTSTIVIATINSTSTQKSININSSGEIDY